ncbi:SUMF1/EgtB/PvdO family nonheme iron enzyme [Sinomicrobium sp.]
MKSNIISKISVFVLFSALMLASCSSSDEMDIQKNIDQPTRIGLEQAALEINVAGDRVSNIVAILGTFDTWLAETDADWLMVETGTTEENGKPEPVVYLSAEENTYYSRRAVVSIIAVFGGKEERRTFEVVQESALDDPALSISEVLLNFTADGETLDLTVTTNQDEWRATTDVDWLSLEQLGNTLAVTTSANTDMEARSGEVFFEAGEEPYVVRDTLLINQAKPDNEESITINGIEMILVKAGTFYMGAQSTDPSMPNYYPDAAANQGPVHQVTITKDFYIGKYELTQAQFENIMGYNPSTTVGSDHPVEMVDWNTAKEFTDKLSQETGRQFRLPTEAEWEYAARGGQESNGFIYSGSNILGDVAYYYDGGDQRTKGVTVPVGSFAPNELGIYDMSGNVYEWVLDKMETYTAEGRTDPIGQSGNNMLRGGSWYHTKYSEAVSYRGNNTADFTRAYLGFRIVYIP